MARGPLLAELDIELGAFRLGDIKLRILDQGVQFEADVAIVALGGFPGRKEYVLCPFHQPVGHGPGDVFVLKAVAHESSQIVVEPPGFNQIGNDDRIGSRSGDAPLTVAGDFIRVDGIEPNFGSGGDQGL